MPWMAVLLTSGAAIASSPSHWSFQRVERPPAPSVRRADWVLTPVDRFVLARLEKEAVSPAPQADRATLLRRLTLDLTGLPPTPEELSAFVTDRGSDAYERAVERLLRSPHYAERWARQWLDLARYADSDGYESDLERPYAWRYRDWVIQAIHRDMPFDRFTIEQLAGDLLPQATVEQRVATGFHRNTLTNREGGVDTEEFRIEQVFDRTNTLGTVWLGLTVGCAQCHDHKHDPIPQRDYYRLFGLFNSMREEDIDAPLPGEAGPAMRALPAWRQRRQDLLARHCAGSLRQEWERRLLWAGSHVGRSERLDLAWKYLGNTTVGGQQILRIPPERRTEAQNRLLTDYFVDRAGDVFEKEELAGHDWERLRKDWKELKASAPVISRAPVIAESETPPLTRILIRGDFRNPGVVVEPGVPSFLPPLSGRPSRLTLARWLVSRDHPLTARVTVNRMWQEFFGRGLVLTAEDFGTQGERPSHPELLDWLAVEFMERGWSVRHIHRLIVMSATYRQSSRLRPELRDRDPANLWLARQNRLRLPAEVLRDAALFAAGLLDLRVGGRSVRPPQPKGVAELGYAGNVKWPESSGADRYRRGLYIHFQRTVPYPMLMNFDAPDSNLSCSRRRRSNTPLQALNLLNDPVFFEAAQALGARILGESAAGFYPRLERGFQLTVARSPQPGEVETMARVFERAVAALLSDARETAALCPQPPSGVEAAEAAAWVVVSRVLLNLDEFVTRE